MARRSSVLVLVALLVGCFALEANAQTEASGGGGLTSPFPSATTVTLGSGTGTGRLLAVYDEQVSAAAVCNSGVASDDVVFTIPSVPANTLTRNGQTILIEVSINTAANANSKRYAVTFGAVTGTIANFAANGQSGVLTVIIRRVTATAIHMTLLGSAGNTQTGGQQVNQAVSDLTTNATALTIKARSETAANDSCALGVTTYITP